MMTPASECLLKILFEWRDATARKQDESVHYVCSNLGLRIAVTFTKTVTALQGVLNPVSVLVMQYADRIVRQKNYIVNG